MKSLVIGISGGSGCGKSTLCEMLEKRLSNKNILSIHMDEHFKNPLPKMKSPITNEEYDDWNHPESIDYSKPLSILKSAINDGSNDIILIEGVTLFCFEKLRELIDLKIFIDLDSDERMYRRIKRNMKFGFQMDEIAEYYLHFAKFREQEFSLRTKVYADVILNGYKLDGKALDVIVAWANGVLVSCMNT